MPWTSHPIPDTTISAEQQNPALRYKYNVSPLGQHSNSKQILEATYQTSPLGLHTGAGALSATRSVGKGLSIAKMVKATYNPVMAGNMSRMSRIIAAAGHGR